MGGTENEDGDKEKRLPGAHRVEGARYDIAAFKVGIITGNQNHTILSREPGTKREGFFRE